MAGNNPRKFKDRIALLNQKEAESTAQFQAVMGDISEVKKKPSYPTNFDGGGGMGPLVGGEALMPRHLAPSLPNHHPHFRYGGSLPNVAQMSNLQPVSQTSVITTAASPVTSHPPDIQFPMPGLTNMNNISPGVDQSPVYHNMVSADYSDNNVLLRGASDRSRGSGGVSPVGGGAIRNRSGERRYDSSPYSDRYNYSSSLVTSYLSPPPESRWRRTSSDSALYQKLTAGQQPQSPSASASSQQQYTDNQSPSEGGSPEYCSQLEDVKPPRALLQSLLQEVKEEPGVIVNGGGGSQHYHSGSSSPVSPLYTPQQSFQPPPSLQPSQQQHNNLEEKFEKFRLDCPPPSGVASVARFPDTLQHNPATPTTGPTSPHTPSTLPDIYIQDWSQHCNDKSLEDDFDELRESLDPIDDQLLATLANSATFVDPAVEEQFKMNY